MSEPIKPQQCRSLSPESGTRCDDSQGHLGDHSAFDPQAEGYALRWRDGEDWEFSEVIPGVAC